MTPVAHDIELLVAIAKVDAGLHDFTVELGKLPGRLAAVDRRLAELDRTESVEVSGLDAMKKERRDLERGLEDAEGRISKYKNQLMDVKSNKEYTAALKEIDTAENEIGRMEERILELMETIEERSSKNEVVLEKIGREREAAQLERKALEERRAFLETELEKLAGEKPGLLAEIAPLLRKRYERLLAKHGDVALARTNEGHCGGCGTQLPPQLVVEVKQNTQIITCQSCGRILIHYS